jgi:hypothetical protein
MKSVSKPSQARPLRNELAAATNPPLLHNHQVHSKVTWQQSGPSENVSPYLLGKRALYEKAIHSSAQLLIT